MRILDVRNVSEAYVRGVDLIRENGVAQNSRAGAVLVLDDPVTTIYRKPTERVLFAAGRRANPVFHLCEAIWMLAGSNDATWLDQFVGDFSKRFAEENGRQHGAYGHRWRNHFEWDQLNSVINRLRKNPDDRRSVIQMWDPDEDLFNPEYLEEETGAPFVEPFDVPCNLVMLPRIVNGALDLTVFNRSNDIIYGAYGSNAVHFSVVQEYLATAIGVPVGLYRQVSNNWHAYMSVLEKQPDTSAASLFWTASYVQRDTGRDHFIINNPYVDGRVRLSPLISDADTFLGDCEKFVKYGARGSYWNNVFKWTLVPMLEVNAYRREKQWAKAMDTAVEIVDGDWSLATQIWIKELSEKSMVK